MTLIDSHCHLDRLDLDPFRGSLAQVLENAAAHGVEYFLCAGIDLEAWPAMLEQVLPFPNVAVSVGVHPCAVNRRAPSLEELTQLANRHPRVVAIGETGLDYFHRKGDKAVQQDRFRVQIAAAKALGKPLIIHTREASADTLRILREEGADAVGGVLHCFSEDWEVAVQAMELNFYISFSGIVTFKGARRIQDVAKRLPRERLLVETDAPYLAPAPHRGQSNQPAWVSHVASAVAELRGEPLARVAETTTANFFRLFNFQ